MQTKRGSSIKQQSLPSPHHVPDNTFMTGVNIAVNPSSPAYERRSIFQYDDIADNVMGRVADDMGLLTSADLLLLKDRATIKSRAFESFPSSSTTSLHHHHHQQQQQQRRQQQLSGQQHHIDIIESIPSTLFNPPIGDDNHSTNPSLSGQPIALRTAMKALQLALHQPLTNYNDDMKKGNEKDYLKTTKLSETRKLPPRRMQYLLSDDGSNKETKNKTPDDENFVDRSSYRYSHKGLKEPKAVVLARQQKRDFTLDQIDEVLSSLNANTDEWMIAQNMQRNSMNPKSEKIVMKEMRSFARPFPGIHNILDMVDEVIDEFQK